MYLFLKKTENPRTWTWVEEQVSQVVMIWLAPKNLEFPGSSSSPVIFQLGLLPKKYRVSRLQL